MRNLFFSAVSIIAIAAVLSVLASCSKDNELVPVESILESQISDDSTLIEYPLDSISDELSTRTVSYPGSSLVSVPELNNYQPSPTTSLYSNGITYYGGPFKSCASNISGTTVTFTLKRTDGSNFPVGSVLRIWKGNLGGELKATFTITSPVSTKTLNITDANTWNLNGGPDNNPNNSKIYYATWYNPTSGLNFYTKFIRIVAVPTGWGVNLGNLNNISVFSNGWGGFSNTNYLLDTYGQKYQCVHYIKRYYKEFYNRTIGPGNADVYWNNYSNVGLNVRIYNGAGIPQQGDILCMKKTSGSSYHVGIIKGVVNGKIRVYMENWGQTPVNNNYCIPYIDLSYTSGQNGYTITGPSTWTVLGWVR